MLRSPSVYRQSDFSDSLFPNGRPECRNLDGRPVYLAGLCGECFAREGQVARGEAPRFEVRALLSGEGYVIVDTTWKVPMIGPYPMSGAGRKRAVARAAEFEADPSKVPGPALEAPVQPRSGKVF
jgi:hypothetical protein